MKSSPEPVAIIGIGCRFPKAAGPEALWRNLVDGVDAIGEIPTSRFPADALYDPRPSIPGRITTRWGGFLDDIELFDPGFFGISPREAAWLDPQQRLLLETTWEALESAGQAPVRLRGTDTAVYMGMWLNEYEARMFRDPSRIDFYMTTGTGRYAASGRLSHFFGWHGPSVTIDCACSSSLVAIHLACRSLRDGESAMAVAGGANVLLEPAITLAYSQSRMMAPDGRCKFGDARANGYVRSEGAAVVVLKLLSRALADGDPIEALIIGSAVNNDGGSGGSFGTPGREGQEDLLRKACRDAGVPPSNVDFVEAHGTGTRAGDPVEIGALAAVLGEGRPPDRPLLIGSVKTNLGHTEGAAGIAGVIKAALALKHRTVPRNLHFETPNPDIPWGQYTVDIPRETRPWPSSGRPGVAGVSSFGIAGTNAHVVLQGYEPGDAPGLPADPTSPRQEPLVLSAHTPDALRALAVRWEEWLGGAEHVPAFADLAATSASCRDHHDHRLAVVADSRLTMLERLRTYLGGEPGRGVFAGERDPQGPPKVVFVCPGQGSQWPGMGRQLYEGEPVFRDTIERCDAAIRKEAGWSLIDALNADTGAGWQDDIAVIQPALFAVEVALADLWRSWGIEPAAVVGHSMGEVAAACIAGGLDLESAVRVICRRSRLMKRVSGRGAMALVDLAMEDARDAVAGYEGRVSVAVSNSLRSTVLSGEPQAVDEILARLEAREVFCRKVKVDVASHSPQMDPIRTELVAALSGMATGDTRIPMVSTVTGTFVRGGELDADYWGRNVREPVLFATAVDLLARDGCRVFLELSPHPILGTSIQQQLGGTGQAGCAWPSLRREEDERFALLETLGGLYTNGCEPDWRQIFPGKRTAVPLPAYPWQRERHWYDAPTGDAAGGGGATNRFGLGRRLDLAGTEERCVWEAAFQRLSHGVHWEHRVGGVATLSAASSLRIVLDAAAERFGTVSEPVLEDVEFLGPIALPDEGDSTALQVVLETEGDRTATFGLHDRSGGAWSVRVRGKVSVGSSGRGPLGDGRIGIVNLREYAPRLVPGADEYESLARAGVAIGDSVRVVDGVFREGGGAIARLRIPESADRLTALLDGVFHLSGIAARGSASPGDGDLFVPVRVDLIRLGEGASPEAWARADRRDAEGAGSGVVEDVVVLDPDGRCLVDVRGVRLSAVAARSVDGMPVEDLLYEVAWQRLEVGGTDETATRRDSTAEDGVWLLFADRHGIATTLAKAIERDGGRPVLIERGDAWCAGNGRNVVVRPGESGDMMRLLQMFAPGSGSACRGLIYLWGLDGATPSPADRDGPVRAQSEACEPLLLLLRRAALASWSSPPRLWLVTAGAQRVVENEPLCAVWHAALWGLGRVVAAEHPEMWGGVVDIDANTPERAADAVWLEVRYGAPEDQVAWRGESRFVARLERRRPSGTAQSPRLRPDATYLVTGGLGALGSEVARWMVTRGARRFLLLGRTVLPPRERWSEPAEPSIAERIRRVRGIEALGASVHVMSVDIAEEGAVRLCLEQFTREGWPPVRGVVHAAGVIQDRLLRDLDVASWREVFRAKGLGGWRLHEAFLGEPLDFFILFSSLGSLLGQEGQGSYAGANAFLDALANHRRASGRKALSLSWGPWSSLGFATTAGGAQVIGQLSRRGIGELTSAKALEVLSRAMGDGAAHVLVAPVDWARFAGSLPPGRRLPLVSTIIAAEGGDRRTEEAESRAASVRSRLEQTPESERRAAIVLELKTHLAQVLKLAMSRIDAHKPFGAMGLTSLLGLEFRAKLERTLEVTLPATLVWNYPTVTALAEHLAARLGLTLEGMKGNAGDVAPAAKQAADVLSNLEKMSDADALRALRGKTPRDG